MDCPEAVQTVFSKYAVFEGRAVRSEFWWWTLFSVGVSVVLNLAKITVSPIVGVLVVLWGLGTLIPNLAVSVRRLHDIDRSGWWWLLWLLPVIGWLILIYWYCQPGTPAANRFDAAERP